MPNVWDCFKEQKRRYENVHDDHCTGCHEGECSEGTLFTETVSKSGELRSYCNGTY
ncbi:MAG: hypothetical protein LBC87_10360 [Fibromonadaceae bacterium]|nr:hypothetical protein [Fibromonadaceae bacterium]